MTDDRLVDERVAKLEVTVTSIATSVDTLAATVNSGFAESRKDRDARTDETRNAFREIQRELSHERESRKPQYQTQAAWAGIVLTIVWGAWIVTSKGYDADKVRIEGTINQLQETRLETAYQRGTLEGKLGGVEKLVTQIDVGLQSEIDAHVKRIDDKLQIEMRGQRDVQQKDIDWVKDRMEKLVDQYSRLNVISAQQGIDAARLGEEQRWTEKGLSWAVDHTIENSSMIDSATAKQAERIQVFEDLKRRVLALEERKP